MSIKKQCVRLALVLCTLTSYAQSTNFGIKGGLNITTINFSAASEPNDNLRYRVSYHVGILAKLRISEAWVLQPEIVYSDQGYKTKGATTIEFSYKYINIPLLFKYQTSGFFFYGGPQFGILLDAHRRDTKTNKKENITPTIDAQELAFTTGLGTMLSQKFGIEGRCMLGITSLSGNHDFLNAGFQTSLFYIFGN